MKFTELRGRRQAVGIRSQRELAKSVGCATETIKDIELGRIGIDEETVNALDEAIAVLGSARSGETCSAGAGKGVGGR